ncbi:MAG: hypothetical protein ACXWHZ_02640 [Usitatibacter sp.]
MYKLTPLWSLRLGGLMVAVLFTASCAALGGAVESRFVLAPDSRLPSWLSIPTNLQRSDVVVVLKYLTPSQQSDDAVVEIQDRQGRRLSSVHGQFCWHPAMQTKKNKFGGFDPDAYPLYAYVKVNGITEVIEHRKEPVFRISDNVELRRSAAASNSCDKG